MMNVLMDANVIITYLTRREDPFIHEIDDLFLLFAEKRLNGYVALQSISAVWYILRKYPDANRRHYLQQICGLLKLAVTDMETIQQALANTAFRDFEDNLQDCCAQSVHADYIVTANVHDYEGHSVVKAVTPAELLAILDASDADESSEVHEAFANYEFAPVSVILNLALRNHHAPKIHTHRLSSKGHRILTTMRYC